MLHSAHSLAPVPVLHCPHTRLLSRNTALPARLNRPTKEAWTPFPEQEGLLTGVWPDLRDQSDKGRKKQRQGLETNLDTWLDGLYLPMALPSSSSDRLSLLIQLPSLGPALAEVRTEGSCLRWPIILICSERRGFQGCRTFSAKIGTILGKLGHDHPCWASHVCSNSLRVWPRTPFGNSRIKILKACLWARGASLCSHFS